MRKYELKCLSCGKVIKDDGFVLECPGKHDPSLIIAQYPSKKFTPDDDAEGIYRYKNWLPVIRNLSGSARTITYQSQKLSRITKLPNLWIAFNGFWFLENTFMEADVCGKRVPITAPPIAVAAPTPTRKATAGFTIFFRRGEIFVSINAPNIKKSIAKIFELRSPSTKGKIILGKTILWITTIVT